MIRILLSPVIFVCALLVTAGDARAQTTVPYGGGTYSQDFDGLPNTGTFTYTGVGPFDFSASPTSIATMQGWYFAKIGGTGANALFRVDTGASNAGSAYSYGVAGVNPVTDRALGSLASGTTVPGFGAVLINNTGGPLNQFTLSYTGEQWRRGSASANTLSFSFGLGNSDIATGLFTPVTSLNFTSPNTTGANVALDGNAPGNNTNITGIVTLTSGSWNPGQRLLIRWTDVDDGGSDDGIAIDNLSFSATAVVLRNLTWTPPPATWNTTNNNWTLSGGGTTAFQTGDVVNFTDSGLAAGSTVTIDPAGVNPAAINVSNTTGTYTFTGGPIQGATTSLTKSGAGTLVLSGMTNTYGGGTFLNGGVVVIDNDNNLGATTGLLNFNGGTLKADAASTGFTVTRPINIDSGGATIDTTGKTLTFSSSFFQGIGPLNITGGGTLVQGAPNVFGNMAGPINITGSGTRLQLNTGNNIAAGSVVTIGTGATLDDSFGDGEGFSTLLGTGTYLGVNNAATTSGLLITATGTFDGLITSGTNGVPGSTPAARRLNLNVSLNVAGGVFTLTNTNSDFAGSILIANGTLSTPSLPPMGVNSPLGVGTDGTSPLPITLGNTTQSGRLQYTGPSVVTDRSFVLPVNTVGGGTIEVANAASTLTLTGPITGGGTAGNGLVKAGPGTLEFANFGSLNYSGGTAVNGGRLFVNTTLGGDVTANAGTLVGGTGTIGGSLMANTFATVAPGAASGLTTGQLTVNGAATLAPGSTLAVELNGTIGGTTHDQLVVSGNVTLSGANLNPSSTSGILANQTLQIIPFGSETGEFFALPEGAQFLIFSSGLPAATPYYVATISYGITVPGAVTIRFGTTPVPEPLHGLVFASGVFGLVGWQRRRRARRATRRLA